jgi:hypothetical protein
VTVTQDTAHAMGGPLLRVGEIDAKVWISEELSAQFH